jgi:hypothetical protein
MDLFSYLFIYLFSHIINNNIRWLNIRLLQYFVDIHSGVAKLPIDGAD